MADAARSFPIAEAQIDNIMKKIHTEIWYKTHGKQHSVNSGLANAQALLLNNCYMYPDLKADDQYIENQKPALEFHLARATEINLEKAGMGVVNFDPVPLDNRAPGTTIK